MKLHKPAIISRSDGSVREAIAPTDPGHLELPIAGRAVCLVGVSRFSPYLRLHFWGSAVAGSTTGPDYTLQVGGPLRIVGRDREWSIAGDSSADPALLLLVDKTVERASASADGGLAVDFTDGYRLVVPPDDYEAWQLDGDDGTLYVSVAGGGLAIWDASTEREGLPQPAVREPQDA